MLSGVMLNPPTPPIIAYRGDVMALAPITREFWEAGRARLKVSALYQDPERQGRALVAMYGLYATAPEALEELLAVDDESLDLLLRAFMTEVIGPDLVAIGRYIGEMVTSEK
jgi:hypothetical protein